MGAFLVSDNKISLLSLFLLVQTDKKHLQHIDALRAIAALMVMCFHFLSFHSEKGFLIHTSKVRHISEFGAQGVELFYIISGFIIFYTLRKSHYTLKRYPQFMLRRIIRIYPPLIGVVVLISLLPLVWNMPYPYSWQQILQNATLTTDCFENGSWMNLIFATLKIEMIFYAAFALIYPLLNLHKIGATFLLLVCLMLGSYYKNYAIAANIPYFVFGICLAQIKLEKFNSWHLLPILLGFGVLLADERYFIEDIVISLFGLIWIAFFNFRFALLSKLGQISYSLYLVHGFIGGTTLYLLYSGKDAIGSAVIYMVIAAILSLSGSYVYYLTVERVFSKWSKKIKSRS